MSNIFKKKKVVEVEERDRKNCSVNKFKVRAAMFRLGRTIT